MTIKLIVFLINEFVLSLVVNSPVHSKVQGEWENSGCHRAWRDTIPPLLDIIMESFLRGAGSGRYSKPCPEHKIDHQSCSSETVTLLLPLSGWWACDSSLRNCLNRPVYICHFCACSWWAIRKVDSLASNWHPREPKKKKKEWKRQFVAKILMFKFDLISYILTSQRNPK